MITLDSPEKIVKFCMRGAIVPQALAVCCRLNLPELLSEPRTIQELAELTTCHAENLYRLLAALATLGFFEETEPKTFKNSTYSRLLVKDKTTPHAMGSAHYSYDWVWKPMGDLYDAIKHGSVPFEQCYGESLFDYLAKKPDAQLQFQEAMTSHSDIAKEVAVAWDIVNPGFTVDVGGGGGTVLAELFLKFRDLEGAIFDLPGVNSSSYATFQSYGLGDRFRFVAGNFFNAVVAADSYILRYILHDWDDARCAKILENIRKVINKNGRVIIIEEVLENERAGSIMDLYMLLYTGGRERTLNDYEKLLNNAGFSISREIQLQGRFRMMVAEVSK